MNINLKDYQQRAVEELVSTFVGLLAKPGQNKICVFQAPTGSGKTLMTAKFIEDLIITFADGDICFVWVSVGKGELHLQSKHSLEKIYGGFPKVSLVEEEFSGGRDYIARNEVVVVNWEKLRSKDQKTGYWKNILMKDGEKINFRDVLRKTKEQRKIILIIDESHLGGSTSAVRTSELRSEIGADVVLEMSATPTSIPDPKDLVLKTAGYVIVSPQDVIDEGMIKKELIINEKIANIPDKEVDSQEVVLEAAYLKRLKLVDYFKSEKSKINPLVLVQIPTAAAGADKIIAVTTFLLTKDINEDNGKLAIWLSEQKSDTLDRVSEPDNAIEFLIFKQAIDTGWDCPRAHILVKFRESHSEIFEIQTVGRILRMPEQKHYKNEELNRGYIYTNVQSIIVKKEDYNPNIIKHLGAKLEKSYQDSGLISFYRSRVDYGDITSSFLPIYARAFCERFGLSEKRLSYEKSEAALRKHGISLDIKKYQQEIISDAKVAVKGFDEIEGEIDSASHARLTIAGNDLQALFEQVIKDNLGSFRSIKRSVPVVKSAIYCSFRDSLGSRRWKEEILMIQKIYVENGNRTVFEGILSQAIDRYKAVREKEIRKKAEQSEQSYEFKLKDACSYNQHLDERVKTKKYVYDPCYLYRDRSTPEKRFEEFLKKKANSLIWWWKNGEEMRDYFGIKYEYPRGAVHTFYPDYLVKLVDGRLGILEIKDVGDRDGTTYTKAKAEKLAEYIRDQKRKDLFGGILVEKGKEWMINTARVYDWNKVQMNDWSEWDKFDL